VTASMGIIVEIFPEERRGSILGLQNAIATILSFAVTLAVGGVATHYGWQAPFSLYGLSLPILLLALIVIPAVSRRQAAAGGSLSQFVPMLPIYALITVSMILSFQTTSEVPVLLAADGIASPDTIADIIAAGTLMFTLGAFAYGTLRARGGVWWTFALGLALQGIGILTLSVGHGIAGIGAGTLLLSLGSGIQTPNLSHWVMERAPLAVRGRAMGLLFSAQFFGPFLNTALVAPAITAYGSRNILAVIAGLIAVGVALAALRARSAPLVPESH
jgi:MFS family permease